MIDRFPLIPAFQTSLVEIILEQSPLGWFVFLVLIAASVLSWAVIVSKWKMFGRAQTSSERFLRAFRKAPNLDSVAVATEQFRPSPLVSVFDFGYDETARQVRDRGGLVNKLSMERSLQLGMSQEIDKLEQNMNILATIAAVSPFVGLFGTVWGIINAFQGLGTAGAVSLRAVAPGISEALLATAAGLGAAIPAAIFYNYFAHMIRRIGARMEDFSLEFMNLVERTYER